MEEVGDIPTKSFTKRELKQKYVLVPQDPESRINTGGMWKFGVVKSSDPKDIHWFFNGEIRTRNRREARQIYNLLQHYCELKNLGEAFAFKVRLKNAKK